MINPWQKQSKVNPQRLPNRQINNDVFHALIAAKLPGSVYQIVLVVIDRAWGFEKHEAPISLSYFQKTTGLSRQSVGIAIQKAESMRLIVVERHGTNPKNPSHYMFNKHYDTWSTRQLNHTSKENELVNQITLDWSTKSPQTSQPLMPSSTMPKETSKETLKEKGAGTAKKRSTPQPVLDIFDEMKAYLGYPNKTDKDPIPTYGKEGQAIKRMLARGFTREEILTCWKAKVAERAEFVSMVWVNEDIDKKGGQYGTRRQNTRALPTTYTPPEEARRQYQRRQADG